MAVFPQNARSVFRVSHGTVPGPTGGGPVTAPGRRLEPSRCIFWVCGRSGVSSGGTAAAPYGTARARATATATAEAVRARRFPGRMAAPSSLRGDRQDGRYAPLFPNEEDYGIPA